MTTAQERGRESQAAGDSHEARLFELFRAYRVPVSRPRGSGSGRRKGDILIGEAHSPMALLLDAKTTLATGARASVTISGGAIVKAAHQATEAGRRPLLAPGLSGLPVGVPADWVMVPATVLAELLEAYFQGRR